ncbi:nucleoside transporter-domain-containing protein [Polychytrium aggregatum]|uniref:nucleoside transporter-domain-containing protein n=1 Tax=Polychytrium aggregatum TaxID=110093 RepID=UPI0022FED9C7|nr:nucleoside transporter-domain-containing protein [Polychytrium aggregatum]KAI9208293.1 nucleoside transporter-domain-containing protein [Polychytrium aggregatum]
MPSEPQEPRESLQRTSREPLATREQWQAFRMWATFFLLGVVSLSGWNAWINAALYFMQRFQGTSIENSFQSYFSLAFMVANLGTLAPLDQLAAILVGPPGLILSLKTTSEVAINLRIFGGGALNTALFLVAALMVPSSLSAQTYFGITLAMVALSGVASALMSSVFAIVANVEGIFTQAVVSGQGFSGILFSVIQMMLIKSRGPDEPSEPGPIVRYFLFAVVTGLASLAAYGYELFAKSAQAHHFMPVPTTEASGLDPSIQGSTESLPMLASLQTDDDALHPTGSQANLLVYRQIRIPVLSLFLTFVLTLAVFPSITTLIVSVGHADAAGSPDALIALHFLVFTVGDWIGKSLPGIALFQIRSVRALKWTALSRILILVLIFCCNTRFIDPLTGLPRARVFPLLFGDGGYLIILFILALSGGALATLLMMVAPTLIRVHSDAPSNEPSGSVYTHGEAANESDVAEIVVHDDADDLATIFYRQKVGDMMVFSLTTGLAVGSASSFLVHGLLCGCNPFFS